MGAHPYGYFIPYQSDIGQALQELRQREFEAGRYNPAIRYIDFPIDLTKPSPGMKHASIDLAREDAGEEGTRSILDIDRVGNECDVGVACAVDNAMLENLYETRQPTHEMVESNLDIFDHIERGQGIYIIVYKNGHPDEIFIAGYSYD